MQANPPETVANSVSPALFAAVVALLLWSGTAIANKVAVNFMDGLTAGVLRSMLAGVVAVVVTFSLRLSFPQSGKDRAILMLSGLSSFAIWPMLLSVGIVRTTVGHAALIMAMIPVFTVLIAAIIQGRLPSIGWWFGAAIALVATTLVVTGRGLSLGTNGDGSSMVGDLIILCGVVFCSVGYVAGGKLSPKIGTAATTFWGLSLALVILIPVFSTIVGRTVWTQVPIEGWLAIAWMTFLSSLVGYALWFYALGQGGIGRIGSLQLIMPVITLAVATIMLDEALTVLLVTSCVAIIAGTFLAQRYATRPDVRIK